MRLRPAFKECDVVYATVWDGYRVDIGDSKFYVIPKADRWAKVALIRSFAAILKLIVRERPHVIITTGAAPGYFAVRIGKFAGARTLWLDSVANSEEISLSGKRAGPHADLWLTQWPQLSAEGGPQYRGSVL
ncbi:glucuronosyltransferase [Mycolicibacterium sp. SCSIO 43805]|uniref:glucuronosyltransferase n=1 Tax=Mycolicibacterium sp. SCSIO 43805 TaxID=3378074 RepID=UPI003AB3FF95